jgi:hypothetical protein
MARTAAMDTKVKTGPREHGTLKQFRLMIAPQLPLTFKGQAAMVAMVAEVATAAMVAMEAMEEISTYFIHNLPSHF